MSINSPNKLVEEFKKSGDFDRIRRELLTQFQSNSEGLTTFKSRVEDVARQRLTSDHNLLYMPQEFIHRELMQELDRFPIVERSTSELPALGDPTLSTRINNSLEKILKDQGIAINVKTAEPTKPQDILSKQKPPSNGGGENHRPGSSEEANKQTQASGGSGAQPTEPGSSDKGKTFTHFLEGSIHKGKQETDPDSMDIGDD